MYPYGIGIMIFFTHADQAERQMVESQQPNRQITSTHIPVSKQAIVALILSLLPIISFVGIILGLRSLHGIRISNGRLGGLGIARLSILIGSASTLLQCAGINYITSLIENIAERGTISCLESTFGDPLSTFEDNWDQEITEEGATAEAVKVLVDETTSRFGKLEYITIATKMKPGGFGNMSRTVPLTLHFEMEDRMGSATILLVSSTFPDLMVVKLKKLHIDGGESGDLVFPRELNTENDGSASDTDDSSG